MFEIHRDFLGPTHQRSNRMKNRPFLKKPLCTDHESIRHYRALIVLLPTLLFDVVLAYNALRMNEDESHLIGARHRLMKARLKISEYEGNSYLGIIFTNE